jgi:hypothetical protein
MRGAQAEDHMRKMTFAGYSVRIPNSPIARTLLGGVLVILGLFGFLPILGFWMIPLGLAILSVDIPAIRRLRRKWMVKLGYWLKLRYPRLARSLGYTSDEG